MSISPHRLAMMALAVWLGSGALVLLATQIGYWRAPAPIPPEISTASTSSRPALKELDTPSIALERPLFWATRRPEPVIALEAPEEEPAKLPKDALLVGMYGSGKDAGVLVKMGERVQRIPLGGKWEGWTLKKLSENSVFLSPPRGKDVELPLRPKGAVAKDKPSRTQRPAKNQPIRKQAADQATTPTPPPPATTTP